MSVLHLGLILGVLGAGPALAQDDPNDAARAELESRQSRSLSPNMGIEPYVPGTQRYVPRTQETNDSNHIERRRREEETFRNPRPPRYGRDRDDDRDRKRKYRPPTVIVRPYYPPPIYVQPPVIVRPYIPPPVYARPYVPPRWSGPSWSGPVHADVVWSTFPTSLYDSLPWRARDEHERAFIAALNAGVGQTLRWREAGARGEITVIDELYVGSSFCRDVVQTIDTGWVSRTTDGRVCIRPGQAWRLVAY